MLTKQPLQNSQSPTQIQQQTVNKVHIFDDFELSFNVLKERQVRMNQSISLSPQSNITSPKKKETQSQFSEQIDQIYESPRREQQPLSPLFVKQQFKIKPLNGKSITPKSSNSIKKGLKQIRQIVNDQIRNLEQYFFTKIKKKYQLLQSNAQEYQVKVELKIMFNCFRLWKSQGKEFKVQIQKTNSQQVAEKIEQLEELADKYSKIQMRSRVLSAWKSQTLISLSKQKISNFLNNFEQKIKSIKIQPVKSPTKSPTNSKSTTIVKGSSKIFSKNNKQESLGFDLNETIHSTKIPPKNTKQVDNQKFIKMQAEQFFTRRLLRYSFNKLFQQVSSKKSKVLIDGIPSLNYYKFKLQLKYFQKLWKQVEFKRTKIKKFQTFRQVRQVRQMLNSWFSIIEIQVQNHKIKELIVNKLSKKILVRRVFNIWAKLFKKEQFNHDRTIHSARYKTANDNNADSTLLDHSKLQKSKSQTKTKKYSILHRQIGIKKTLQSHFSFFKK